MFRQVFMGKRKSKDVFSEFVNGRAFVRVKSKKGYVEFTKLLQNAYPEVMFEVPQHYIDDFDKNYISKEYHLVFFNHKKTVKCADKEFFDYVFKTDWTLNVKNTRSKIIWFEV